MRRTSTLFFPKRSIVSRRCSIRDSTGSAPTEFSGKIGRSIGWGVYRPFSLLGSNNFIFLRLDAQGIAEESAAQEVIREVVNKRDELNKPTLPAQHGSQQYCLLFAHVVATWILNLMQCDVRRLIHLPLSSITSAVIGQLT